MCLTAKDKYIEAAFRRATFVIGTCTARFELDAVHWQARPYRVRPSEPASDMARSAMSSVACFTSVEQTSTESIKLRLKASLTAAQACLGVRCNGAITYAVRHSFSRGLRRN